jgi:hypothetical protein
MACCTCGKLLVYCLLCCDLNGWTVLETCLDHVMYVLETCHDMFEWNV